MSASDPTTLEVIQDDSASGGGYAALRFTPVDDSGKDLRFFIEDVSAGTWLASNGEWVKIEQGLEAREYGYVDRTLSLYVGPEVVNRVRRFAQIRVSVPSMQLTERVVWPSLRVAGKGQPLPVIESLNGRPPVRPSGPELPESTQMDGSGADNVRDGDENGIPGAPGPGRVGTDDDYGSGSNVLGKAESGATNRGPIARWWYGLLLFALLGGAVAGYMVAMVSRSAVDDEEGANRLRAELAESEAETAEVQGSIDDVIARAEIAETERDAASGALAAAERSLVSAKQEDAIEVERLEEALRESEQARADLARTLEETVQGQSARGSDESNRIRGELEQTRGELLQAGAMLEEADTELARTAADLERADADLARVEDEQVRFEEELEESRERVGELEDRLTAFDRIRGDLTSSQQRVAELERALAEQNRRGPPPGPDLTGAPKRADIVNAVDNVIELRGYSVKQRRGLVEALVSGQCLATAMRDALGTVNQFSLRELKRRLPEAC